MVSFLLEIIQTFLFLALFSFVLLLFKDLFCNNSILYQEYDYQSFEEVKTQFIGSFVSRFQLILFFIALLEIPSLACLLLYHMISKNNWKKDELLPSNSFQDLFSGYLLNEIFYEYYNHILFDETQLTFLLIQITFFLYLNILDAIYPQYAFIIYFLLQSHSSKLHILHILSYFYQACLFLSKLSSKLLRTLTYPKFFQYICQLAYLPIPAC